MLFPKFIGDERAPLEREKPGEFEVHRGPGHRPAAQDGPPFPFRLLFSQDLSELRGQRLGSGNVAARMCFQPLRCPGENF